MKLDEIVFLCILIINLFISYYLYSQYSNYSIGIIILTIISTIVIIFSYIIFKLNKYDSGYDG